MYWCVCAVWAIQRHNNNNNNRLLDDHLRALWACCPSVTSGSITFLRGRVDLWPRVFLVLRSRARRPPAGPRSRGPTSWTTCWAACSPTCSGWGSRPWPRGSAAPAGSPSWARWGVGGSRGQRVTGVRGSEGHGVGGSRGQRVTGSEGHRVRRSQGSRGQRVTGSQGSEGHGVRGSEGHRGQRSQRTHRVSARVPWTHRVCPGGDSHGPDVAPGALCVLSLSGGDRLQELLWARGPAVLREGLPHPVLPALPLLQRTHPGCQCLMHTHTLAHTHKLLYVNVNDFSSLCDLLSCVFIVLVSMHVSPLLPLVAEPGISCECLTAPRCSCFRESWRLWTRPGTQSTSSAPSAEPSSDRKVPTARNWFNVDLLRSNGSRRWTRVSLPPYRFPREGWEGVLQEGLLRHVRPQVWRLHPSHPGELHLSPELAVAPRVLRLQGEHHQNPSSRVCIYIYMYVNIYICVYIYIFIIIYIYVCKYIYICVYIYMYVNIYIYMCIYIYIYNYIYMYVNIEIYVYIFILIYTYINMYIYIYILYICIYIIYILYIYIYS